MRLVSFQEPVFSTLQGEGALVGMPSTFVRLWGCDGQCSWCDTKESWRPGSSWVECDVKTITEQIERLNNQHIVITGGNPLLQGQELMGLIPQLTDRGYHITLETQASIYHRVLRHVNLISLSPKLHAWNWEVLQTTLVEVRVEPKQQVQFKIVVTSKEEVIEAIHKLDILKGFSHGLGYRDFQIHCFLQPESSRGRVWVHEVMRELQSFQRTHTSKLGIRVLPQVHKYLKIV